jgi:hypothetical protein
MRSLGILALQGGEVQTIAHSWARGDAGKDALRGLKESIAAGPKLRLIRVLAEGRSGSGRFQHSA